MKQYGSGKSISLIIASTMAFSLAFALISLTFDPPVPGVSAFRDAIPLLSGDTVTGKVSREDSLACLKSLESGDRYFKTKDYLNAKSAYQVAVSQDPFNETAKTKLRQTMDLLRSQKAQNILFDVAVASADKLYQAGDYDRALQEYENASKLLPSDPYPKNKINEIIKIRVDNQVKEEEYKKAIANADRLLQMKSYPGALADYKKAAGIRPDEKYPKDRIRELDGLIATQKAKDEAYSKAIAQADQSFTASQYPGALKSYKDALAIKPEQAYPKDRIREIEGILARNARSQADYDKYLGIADSLYIEKNYLRARENYLMASSVKPSEAYPKEMASKAEKMLTGQEAAMTKALEEQYAKTLAGADKLFSERSYEPARAEYAKASNLKPSEQYPKDKVAEIDKIFADALKDKEERYRLAIAAGDKASAGKIWETARTEYTNALEIKPEEVYPKTKLAEIEKLITADAKQKAADARYANTIGKGDSLLMVKAYLASKSAFENASRMKPEEVYPKNKIVEINMILYKLEQQKQQDALYSGMLAKADKLLAEKSYESARAEYVRASDLKPSESYPKEKMTKIDSILSDLSALKALNDRYTSALAAADKLFSAKSYEKARTGYQEALALKSSEKYPADRIAEIDGILAGIAAAKSLDENYAAAIAAADKLLAEKSYEPAKTEYVRALDLKPLQEYPKTRIAEIDKVLAEIARLKEIDDRYAAAIALGDKLLADKSYEPAKAAYVRALDLKPLQEYPKAKIAEIDKALADAARLKAIDDQYAAIIAGADKLLAEKSYELAKAEYVRASGLKPSETYPKTKLGEIDQALAELARLKDIDDRYAAAIASADKLLAGKSYEPAKAEYVRALDLKPLQEYPKTRIAEIDQALAEIARLKSIDDQYAAAIASGDKLLAEKSYEPAKAEYVRALDLKPLQEYPKTRIAEIDKVLAEIARLKEIDDRYTTAITSGDKLLADKSYEPAKAEYGRALDLKPLQEYPKTRIAEIDKALADVARLKAIDDQYAAIIAGADKLLAEKSYESAKAEYVRALNLKPLQEYPQAKIAEIDQALAEIARLKALDDQYASIVKTADNMLADKSYEQAKAGYVRALDLKPLQEYPKTKIAQIDAVLAEIKAKEDAYKASIASADQLLIEKKYAESRTEYQNALAIKPQANYPKEKIAEINRALEELLGKQKFYDNLIAEADNLLKEKDYSKAKEGYQQALSVFPDQPYPKTQISLITARIDSLYRANKSFYDKAVADGDRFYNLFEFDKAIDAYTEAIAYLPMEKYPREMIVTIRRTIAENAIADVLNSPVTIASNTEKQFSFAPVNIASRKNNFVYIKIKNLSGKPFNVLMRYGKDKQPNGGVVMRNLTPDGKVNERLVSVRDQDLWSREDNNWISLYPQGGDVEVSFIQVSRAKK